MSFKLIGLICFALILSDANAAEDCPEGWITSPHGCFFFAIDIEPKTWEESVEYCEELGGYLAEVKNDEIQTVLVEEATALDPSTNWWLGATDKELEGTWVWTRSGHIVDMNSHAWGPGLPDQYNGLNEDCLHLMADLGFQWNDISCGTKDMEWNGKHKPMKPICQKKLCPANWIDGAELGCFSFADEGMNWFDGAEYCYYQNAILAQVPDLATQTFLEYHAADIHNGNPEFWLGANDIFTEGSWIWSTSGIKMDFSNWQKGQPDNNEGIQHCLFLGTKDNDFKWGDDKCIQNSKRPLCQKLKTYE